MAKRRDITDVFEDVKRRKVATLQLTNLLEFSGGTTFVIIFDLLEFKDHLALCQVNRTLYAQYTTGSAPCWKRFTKKQKYSHFLFLNQRKPYKIGPLLWYLNNRDWPDCTKCERPFVYETEKGFRLQPFMKNPLGVYMCNHNCGNTTPSTICGFTLDQISDLCIATSRQRDEKGQRIHSWTEIAFDLANKADSYCSRCGALAITEVSEEDFNCCSHCGVRPVEECVCESCKSCGLILGECQCDVCAQCDLCRGCETCEVSELICGCEFCDDCGLELLECECNSMEEF
jgi:hypothetical protein